MNRSHNAENYEDLMRRIRQHLQKPDVQERISATISSVRSDATVTTSGAARMLKLGEQQLRDWEKRGLISTTRPLVEGKQTQGHRQFSLEELNRVAVLKELIEEGNFTPGEFEHISDRIEEIWREVMATGEQQTLPVSQKEELLVEAELPIDQRITYALSQLFWRFYTSHALRLSLLLIGEDMPNDSVILLLPLQPDEALLPVTHIENIRLLGESLVGRLGHSRSSFTLLTRSPHFSFNSDYRIHPLLAMENGRLREESSPDHTHIIVRREARPLTLRPEAVEMIRALLKPLYDNVEMIRTCFGQDMGDEIESSPNLDNTGSYPDRILNNLAEMIVQLGDSEQGKQRWRFCCILLPKDPVRPLQQRTLVVRAQSEDSPHKIGVASVSPTVEMSSLSLRAYQSGQVYYRETVSPEDTVIAFHDVEHYIHSAIAVPIGAEYGEPIAVIYVASEFDRAFSEERDRCLLRLLGRMVGEAIKSYQMRRQGVEQLSAILDHPDIVDSVVGSFFSENRFIDDLEKDLRSFQEQHHSVEQSRTKPIITGETVGDEQLTLYALAFVGVDVDHSSSIAAKYGHTTMRNLYREIGQRIKSELASTFRMYPEGIFYHIYADRFVVALKNITHEQLISKARLLKKSLDVPYKVSLLSTQQPPPVHLEDFKDITVRLAVSAYTANTLERLLDEYRGQNNINKARESIERSLATELNKGMSDGGNQIRAWNPKTRLFERLYEN